MPIDKTPSLRTQADGAAGAAAGPKRPAAGLGRNFAAMLLWQVGSYLVPLVTFPYLTRVLGPSQFGVVSYVTALTVYGTVLTEWGFNLSGPRAVAQAQHDRRTLNGLVWAVIGAKGCLCIVSAAILALVACVDRQMDGLGVALAIGWLGVAANVFTLNWLLQGLERFSAFAAIALASRFATFPLVFWLVKSSSDVNAAVGIQAVAALLVALGSLLAAHRHGLLGRPRCTWAAVRAQLAGSMDMFISTASVSLFSATNTLILGSFSGAYQVGLYASADKLKTVGNMVPAQINSVLYPRIAALFAQRHEQGARAAARLTVLGVAAIALTTGIGLAVCLTLSDVLTRLVLGNQFVEAATIVNWLCLSTLFGNLAYFLGLQVLVPFGGASRRARAMLAAGAFNVLLACVLVPRFGARGAALAYLTAEASLLAVYAMWIVRSPPLRAHFMQLWRS
ncbi:flippase [Burkholderia sp. Bp9125]|nr:flippase [Burkholderia sp. Bp9125]